MKIIVFLACLAFVVATIGACSTPPPPPKPDVVSVTKEVERIVQVKCEDKRIPREDLPDDDADLLAVEKGDIFRLAQIYRAARELYRDFLKRDDAQIKACAGQ